MNNNNSLLGRGIGTLNPLCVCVLWWDQHSHQRHVLQNALFWGRNCPHIRISHHIPKPLFPVAHSKSVTDGLTISFHSIPANVYMY